MRVLKVNVILTLVQGHLRMKIKLAFLSKYWVIFSQMLNVSLEVQGNKLHQNNAGHMTKMAAMPIYGKNTLKIFFP